MFAGGYLIGSTGIRFQGPRIRDLKWIPEELLVKGKLEPGMLRRRTEMVCELVPGRLKTFVIVNANFSDFECLQAVADVGEKYADNVIVITSLLARLTFALEDLAKFRNPPEDEVILVVTVASMFADFVILRRDRHFKLYIAEHIIRKPNECERMFPEIYNDVDPHTTIICAYDDNGNLANDLKNQYQPENCFLKIYRRWDFSLLWGGLFYAMEDEDFDSRYRIANFTNGIETSTGYQRSVRNILLPERSAVPCDIHGINGRPQPIKLYFFQDFFQMHDTVVYQKKPASNNVIKATGSSKQIIGYVDERGVPYAHPKAEVEALKKEEHQKRTPETPKKENSTLSNLKTTVTQAPKEDAANQSSTSSTENGMPPILKNESAKTPARRHLLPVKSVDAKTPSVKFKIKNDTFAIEIFRNGAIERIKNSEGNEWTPLYLSMREGKPEIGEKAKDDYTKFPQYVIYDILKVIGKPFNEIQKDPKWGFVVAQKNGNICFQIETPNGAIQIPQEIVISAFLRSMKLRAKSFMGNTELKEICVSTSFNLTESQEVVFKEAALKNSLDIFAFVVSGDITS